MKKQILCEGSMADRCEPGPLSLVRMELSTASPLRWRHHASAGAAISGLAGVVAFERIPLLTRTRRGQALSASSTNGSARS